MISAMIFAAGMGTRLQPWSQHHPKALVPIDGVPILGRVVKKLKGVGATRIIINTHHFADQIAEYIRCNNFGVEILISPEAELLDTGGGVYNALSRFGVNGPLLIHNADILTDFPLGEMLQAYDTSHATSQLLVAVRHTSRYLFFDSHKYMVGWYNPATGEVKGPAVDISDRNSLEMLAFGGVHLLSPTAQEYLIDYGNNRGAFSIIDYYIHACSEVHVKAFTPTHPYLWHDVGTNEKLASARAAWQNKYGRTSVLK